ncbi:MAG: hypothetical protein LBH16_03300 [Treponema sp.]|nr:hypothetical protein [Treponema sp.]
MSAKKKVLIITDGSESVKLTAQSLEEALTDYSVKVCSADAFNGTDLLAADSFFLGCEKSSPASFSYLQKMLSHINLAGRKCGIFSSNEKAVKYLKKILKDSEATISEPLLAADGKARAPAIKKLIKETI